MYVVMTRSDDGDVYACGWDSHGQLGAGTDAADPHAPRLNRALPNVVDLPGTDGRPDLDVAAKAVAAGSAHSALLTTDGRLVTFGYGAPRARAWVRDAGAADRVCGCVCPWACVLLCVGVGGWLAEE